MEDYIKIEKIGEGLEIHCELILASKVKSGFLKRFDICQSY